MDPFCSSGFPKDTSRVPTKLVPLFRVELHVVSTAFSWLHDSFLMVWVVSETRRFAFAGER